MWDTMTQLSENAKPTRHGRAAQSISGLVCLPAKKSFILGLFGSGDVFHILRHKKADTSAARPLQIKIWVDNRNVFQFSIKHKH